ncbi:hypothetical protein HDV00_003345 [Rhizophlyctis rosea]|nr:hypothetical protein HDV00_003345 [Rhizophlyctis rosea]
MPITTTTTLLTLPTELLLLLLLHTITHHTSTIHPLLLTSRKVHTLLTTDKTLALILKSHKIAKTPFDLAKHTLYRMYTLWEEFSNDWRTGNSYATVFVGALFPTDDDRDADPEEIEIRVATTYGCAHYEVEYEPVAIRSECPTFAKDCEGWKWHGTAKDFHILAKSVLQQLQKIRHTDLEETFTYAKPWEDVDLIIEGDRLWWEDRRPARFSEYWIKRRVFGKFVEWYEHGRWRPGEGTWERFSVPYWSPKEFEEMEEEMRQLYSWGGGDDDIDGVAGIEIGAGVSDDGGEGASDSGQDGDGGDADHHVDADGEAVSGAIITAEWDLPEGVIGRQVVVEGFQETLAGAKESITQTESEEIEWVAEYGKHEVEEVENGELIDLSMLPDFPATYWDIGW